MTLRRFPWKAPRLSDNSYRLFVSPPDPGQDQLLDSHRRSVAAKGGNTAPPSRNPSGDASANESDNKHHHHHHHQKNESTSQSEPVSRQSTASGPDAQPTIKGPVRLLRLLPRETRHIIGRMLELDPKKRASTYLGSYKSCVCENMQLTRESQQWTKSWPIRGCRMHSCADRKRTGSSSRRPTTATRCSRRTRARSHHLPGVRCVPD